MPIELIDRLAHDADAGVRARVAVRNNLDEALLDRFVDPTTETSPIVWRALAATRAGGTRAEALVATGDHTTLLILATNPATPSEVLATLQSVGDRELTATVAATQHGRAPHENVISKVLAARNITSRPLASPPQGTRWPGPSTKAAPSAIPAFQTATGPGPDDPGSHRGLVIGFAVAVTVVLAAAIVTLGVGKGSTNTTKDTTTTIDTGSTESTRPATPATVTADPTTSVASPTSSSDNGAIEPVTLQLTMTAQNGRFCENADVTINYEAPLSQVVITDDQNRELFKGDWPAGSTRTIQMVEPTATLFARLTTRADPDHFQPSGSVAGTFC